MTPSPLLGAWKLLSGSYTGDDGRSINYASAAVKSIKVLSENQFSFVTTSKDGFYAAAAGSYTAVNGLYIEIPTLASHAEMVGQRYEFQFNVSGDTWTNSRYKDGLLVENEVWRRVS